MQLIIVARYSQENISQDAGNQVLELNPERSISIGRSKTSDIVIPFAHVSRKHAILYHEIENGGDSFWVEDLSAGETFLNSYSLDKRSSYPLYAGDTLVVGGVKIDVLSKEHSEPKLAEQRGYLVGSKEESDDSLSEDSVQTIDQEAIPYSRPWWLEDGDADCNKELFNDLDLNKNDVKNIEVEETEEIKQKDTAEHYLEDPNLGKTCEEPRDTDENMIEGGGDHLASPSRVPNTQFIKQQVGNDKKTDFFFDELVFKRVGIRY